jgi:hypothetical protein
MAEVDRGLVFVIPRAFPTVYVQIEFFGHVDTPVVVPFVGMRAEIVGFHMSDSQRSQLSWSDVLWPDCGMVLSITIVLVTSSNPVSTCAELWQRVLGVSEVASTSATKGPKRALGE